MTILQARVSCAKIVLLKRLSNIVIMAWASLRGTTM